MPKREGQRVKRKGSGGSEAKRKGSEVKKKLRGKKKTQVTKNGSEEKSRYY